MRKRFMTLTLVLCILFSLASTAGAAVQASEYLNTYSVALSAEGDGQMAITIIVDGVYRMSRIGVLEVFIEEKNTSTSSWHEYDTYYGTDDPDTFFDTNSYDYMRTVYFDGVPGRYYRVTLLVYAGDSTGGDTGWITSSTQRCT